jgi:chorismate mutase/prephenate dehydratase
MSASLSLERPPRVGYLGPKGSFSHEAAVSKFGESVDYEPLEDIRAIFSEISRGHVNYGVVPVENTTGGAILDTLDAFIEHETRICCELFRPIHQHLMARCRQDEIAVVYSRPEALRQCRRWLTETGLASRTAPAPSTSRAAEMAAAEVGAAAIGSRLAAKMYGLPILAENIEDHPRNATRFFVLGGDPTPATGNDRTSLMLVTVHRAGALVDVLVSFQRAGVNMTMLTSRPSPSVENEYNFFIDVEGHVDDPSFAAAIEEARRHCRTLVVLGSYPRASEGDSR